MFRPYTYYLSLFSGKGELLELNCWKIFCYFSYDHIILWSSLATMVEKMAFVALEIKQLLLLLTLIAVTIL